MIKNIIVLMLLILFPAGGLFCEQPKKAPISVSVACVYGNIKASLVGVSKEERLRERRDPDLRVIIKNISKKPIKLIYWSCEGEQQGLSFTVAIYGRVEKLSAIARECDKNAPKHFILEPEAQKSLDIDTTGSSRFYWPKVIPKVSETTPVQITAHYAYSLAAINSDGSEAGVRAGEVSSEPLDTLITR